MTAFEHLSVLISIVIGLALTQLLVDLQRLVQARARVASYWLCLLWAALLFMDMVAWWWALFGLRAAVEWNFFYFLFVLLSPVTLFLAATFALPDVGEERTIDMRAYYWDNRRFFFGLLAASTLLDAVRRGVHAGTMADPGALANAITGLLLASLGASRSERYHAVATLAVTGLFLWFIVSAALELA